MTELVVFGSNEAFDKVERMSRRSGRDLIKVGVFSSFKKMISFTGKEKNIFFLFFNNNGGV